MLFARDSLTESRTALLYGIGIAIAMLAFLVFLPVLENGFVDWDDQSYVFGNINIRSLDANFIKWAFTSVVAANWHPLTLISHAIDYAAFGLDPRGHHLVSAFLHSLNTFLVFLLSFRLVCFGMTRRSAVVAATVTALFFALHPLHVESVAWVSERKDLLCALFYLLALHTYIKYTCASKRRYFYYVLTLFLFICALMSKPMAVTFPVVMFILDFYPLKRPWSSDRNKILMEKLPFIALSISIVIVTIWIQHSQGAVLELAQKSVSERLMVAARGYTFYIQKTIWPVNLAPLYPYPKNIEFFSVVYAGSIALLAAITAIVFYCSKRKRLYLALWAYFILTLLPVIGLVQVGSQAAADRYTYLPGLALFLAAGLGVTSLYETFPRRSAAAIISVVVIIFSFFLGYRTINQVPIWKDTLALWSYEIELYPDAESMVYYNRGIANLTIDRNEEAVSDFTEAIRISSPDAKKYNNRGVGRAKLEDYEGAIEDFNMAIILAPQDADFHRNLANVYNALGMREKALYYFSKAAALGDPFSSEEIRVEGNR